MSMKNEYFWGFYMAKSSSFKTKNYFLKTSYQPTALKQQQNA